MRTKAALVTAIEESEKEMAQVVGSHSEDASRPFQKLPPDRMEAIILEHRDHGKRLAWSFLTTWRIRMKQDEVISVVGAALCEAANRFDETRGVSFKTFFFYHLRGMLLKEISRMINEQKVLQFLPQTTMGEYTPHEATSYAPLAVASVEQNNPERLIEKKEIARICWDACSQLDSLEQEVIVRHFIYDEPLIDIASELKYCRCHISRVKSRGLAKLQRLLQDAVAPGVFETREEASGKLSPEARAALESFRKVYTGGRGRRRAQGGPLKSSKLSKVA